MTAFWSSSRGLGCLLFLTSVTLVACGGSSSRRIPGNDSGEGGEGAEPAGTSGRGGSGGTSDPGTGGSSASGGSSATGGTNVPEAGTGGMPPPDTELTLVRRQRDRKVDLLFMVDNSISMFDKQALLSESIPRLVLELTSRRCLDDSGTPNGEVADAEGVCANGTPEATRVVDLHMGIVTSSLGDHGSHDVCSDASSGRTPNDKAQLLPSVRTSAPGNDSGFLAWEPGGDATAISDDFRAQLFVVGELGCGYESSLEAWYRFLVDPEPVGTIDNDMTTTVRVDTNSVILEQRAEFLRPDSVLGIVMLSDENDCSILDEATTQGWLVGFKGGPEVNSWRMPASTASCKRDPNDPCCRPCIVGPAAGCGDNTAEQCPAAGYLTYAEDSMNQRCFQQMQRFGISLLYPTSRYIEALTSPFIDPRLNAYYVPNPLFAGNFPAQLRSPRDVALIGILGVPWQDVATSESLSDERTLRFLTPDELSAQGRWDVILGAPELNVLPKDPFMIESIDPRPTGMAHPLVPGVTVVGPGQSDMNPINGHETTVDPVTRDDLQYACIFPLREPVACNTTNAAGCDCNAEEYVKQSALCDYEDPDTNGTQVNAKAYPSLRQLEVLKGVGSQGLVTSICPKNTEAETADPSEDLDYGYNPAARAIVDLVKKSAGYECIGDSVRTEQTDGGYQLACPLIAITSDCACDATQGLDELTAPLDSTLRSALTRAGYCGGTSCENVCLCEVVELWGDSLTTCQNDPESAGDQPGFCLLDASSSSVNPSLLDSCPDGAKRSVRFSGPPNDTVAAYLIACSAAL